MPQVSKREIEDKNLNKVINKLIDVIEQSAINGRAKLFVSEFLYPTEKVMLAKRIGIIHMLDEGIPDRVIADTLSVSTSTIGRMIDKYERGEYKYLVALVRKNKRSISDMIEEIYFILPPKVGRKRYRYVRQGKYHI